ncbi:MAG: hypothetical protein K2I70_00660, partial [Bacilli bacterium]|nr:hypothetical protein [Bacilli bacterium]
MNDNRKLNVILGIVSVVAIIISLYLGSIINNNEKARIYFHMEDIENINWIDSREDISFKINDDKLYFKIGEEVIVDNKDIELNEKDGNIRYDGKDGKLYLRSVSKENIVVWYEKREYRLSREVI